MEIENKGQVLALAFNLLISRSWQTPPLFNISGLTRSRIEPQPATPQADMVSLDKTYEANIMLS